MHNIIPNKFYFIDTFKKNEIDKLTKETGVIFRNYKDKISISKLVKLKNYCAKKRIKLFLSNNFKIALKLNLDGVYLPSFNKEMTHLAFVKKPSFLILGSAHNIKEIRIKESQQVKLIFISSLFKKNKNYLGFNKFKVLRKLTSRDVIALGGISKFNERRVKLLDCFGISGISYFQKKGPKNGALFIN